MTDYSQPVVGIGVLVWKDGKMLFGQRRGSHGSGEYCWPGGKLDLSESFEECARREVREETGIEIGNIRFIRLMNLKKYAPKHFVDIALQADWVSGEPEVKEPAKYKSWGWYDRDQLPTPIFAGEPESLEALRTGQVYWDA